MGDHANASFLHSVRRVVQKAVGLCSLIHDPTRNRLVDGFDVAPLDWLQQCKDPLVGKPDPSVGKILLDQYLWTTNGLLDLLDKDEITSGLPGWMEKEPDAGNSISAKYYLVLAIGAQCIAEASDEAAESYFKSGRYLTMLHFMDKPSLLGVQCFLLVIFFLVAASRRNAASMNLGIAVHGAHALGIHQRDVSKLFKSDEYRVREHVWRSMRVLDVFLSGSLGRPLATAETRRMMEGSCSAVVSLCWITERILNKVYCRRLASMATVEEISKHHRGWVSRLPNGLTCDGILSTLSLDADRKPNLGLCHLRCEYYVSIILLTRPFLLDTAAKSLNDPETDEQSSSTRSSDPPLDKVLLYACVDSAVRILETTRPLLRYDGLPKRLPFVVNAVFLAGLVAGLAFFAKLRRHFPLHECLGDALKLLKLISGHDIVARRGLSLLTNLEAACRTLAAKQDRGKDKSRRQLVTSVFGHFQVDPDPEMNSFGRQHDQERSLRTCREPALNSTPGDPELEVDYTQDSQPLNIHRVSQSDVRRDISEADLMLASFEDSSASNWQAPTEGDEYAFDSSSFQWHQSERFFGSAAANLSGLADQYWESQNLFSLD